MQIQISWLLQKPTDLGLHCLQRQGISGFSRIRVKIFACISQEIMQKIDMSASYISLLRVTALAFKEPFKIVADDILKTISEKSSLEIFC